MSAPKVEDHVDLDSAVPNIDAPGIRSYFVEGGELFVFELELLTQLLDEALSSEMGKCALFVRRTAASSTPGATQPGAKA